MSAYFDVVGEVSRRGAHVPEACHYRESPFGPDVSEWAREVFDDLAPTEAELQRLITFCRRLTGRLDRAGLSY